MESRYEFLDDLTACDRYVVRRGRRPEDAGAVLLKGLARPGRSSDLQRLEREHRFLEDLEIPGVPRPIGMILADNDRWLALEPRPGEPLSRLASGTGVGLGRFFEIARSLCAVLEAMHRRGLVAGALDPRMILFDAASGATTLLDMTLSSGGRSEARTSPPIHQLGGTLAYLSPERTGRIGRAADERSDLYSLGVVLYQALTGLPPFQSADPLELVHAHIARTPVPATRLAPEVPGILSQIVARLLQKNPDERYQTAAGLADDLETVARSWQAGGRVEPFPLGTRDVSDRFVLPVRLYGREREVERLHAAFDRARGGRTSAMLVAGYSGIGKTSLIQELARPVELQRGGFVSGKFDQVVRSIPFGALVQAFRALIGQLLTENEETLAAWRERLSAALQPNAGVVTEVIPEVALILGDQPAPPPLGPTETQNRFQLAFQNFVAALAGPEHPLVVLLDDLQWADAATLGLLEPLLTSPDITHLLVIGVYRDNEVDAAHPLTRAISGLEAAGVTLDRIALGPLGLPEVVSFLTDALHRTAAEVESLARLIVARTDGNPFFMIQFLRALHEEGLIAFDRDRRHWTFRMDAIAQAGMTENVADLMSRKIRRLSGETQRVLTLAACIGSPFDLEVLSVVSEKTGREALKDLLPAVEEGLLLQSGGDFLSPSSPGAGLDGTAEAGEPPASFTFLHDRVQQAAYVLIPEEARRRLHLRIGRLLLARHGGAVPEDRLFEVVGHLNRVSDLIEAADERILIARLNLAAARRARASTAWREALDTLHAGLALAGDACWNDDYDLAYALNVEAAECEHLCGRFEEAERRFSAILARARSPLDRARVHAIRGLLYENQSRYLDALSAGREGLELLGIRFPDEAGAEDAALEAEVAAIESLRAGRPILSLAELPVTRDASVRQVMGLLTSIWAPAYISGRQPLTRLISARMVRLSLEHGNCEESAYGYVTHAITEGPVRGDYAAAYEWGRLALAVNEALDDRRLRAKVNQQFHAHVNLWRRPLETSLPYAREACRSGLESGDFIYAGYGAVTECFSALPACRDLGAYVERYKGNLALLRRIRLASFEDAQQVMLRWALALQGKTREPASLSDDEFDERVYLEKYGGGPEHHFFQTFFHTAKTHLLYLFGRYPEAMESSRRAHLAVHSLHGTIWPVLLDFYHGLAAAASADEAGEGRAGLLASLAASCDSLGRLAEHCPENYRCAHLILSGEQARLEGREMEALSRYEAAARVARDASDRQGESLAAELAGRLWRARGNERIAGLYLREACDRYREWGAFGKARELAARHADLPALAEAASGLARGPEEASETAERELTSLDFQTFSKAARAVAGEIRLDDLLRKLVRLAIENAGAQRGVFLREEEGRLVMEAEATTDQEVSLLRGRPLEERPRLARSVVNYVRKTGESLVVADAAKDSRFARDPWVLETAARSILCVPVLHQGQVAGLFYLENSLTRGAFTDERVRVMQVLSSEVAISLENARLYESMRQEVAARRRVEEELRLVVSELEGLKNRLQAENVYLQEEIRTEHNFEEIVGSSPPLMEVLAKVERVAPTEATVLIRGETGTGKELIARAIHHRSPRSRRPLVKLNCGAISPGLVESELFGHVKGAFTGALDRRIGRFELAAGGSLFLDEVGELPPETQVKLLRVLQEEEFEPVGSNRTVRVNVRVIAATNKRLEDAMKAGAFRSDLFYRLNVFPIDLPPLRERVDDIPKLVAFFIGRTGKQLGKRIEAVTEETMARLKSYGWPGNIRELQNIVERAVILSTGPLLSLGADLLPTVPRPDRRARRAAPDEIAALSAPNPAEPPGGHAGAPVSLDEAQRRHILSVLERTGWVIEGERGAARTLSLHPNTLRSRMKRLGISRPSHDIS